MKTLSEAGYNERLFSGGIRARLHLARFRWLTAALRRAGAGSRRVVELGCFDGRAIEHLPAEPELYVGLDANVEGGLDAAKERFRDRPDREFRFCETPDDLRRIADGRTFDTAVSLETLEHVPPAALDDYVRALSEVTRGVLAVTVPNEKGPVFLGKYVFKKLFGETQPYRPGEILAATLGRLDRIERDEHKGFDYAVVVETIGRHFDLVEVRPYPLRRLPRFAGFGVGIVARSKSTA